MYKNTSFFIDLLLRYCVFNQVGWDKKWYHIVLICMLLIARMSLYLVVNSLFESHADDLCLFGIQSFIFFNLYNFFV